MEGYGYIGTKLVKTFPVYLEGALPGWIKFLPQQRRHLTCGRCLLSSEIQSKPSILKVKFYQILCWVRTFEQASSGVYARYSVPEGHVLGPCPTHKMLVVNLNLHDSTNDFISFQVLVIYMLKNGIFLCLLWVGGWINQDDGM
jgi:hypothetical protein